MNNTAVLQKFYGIAPTNLTTLEGYDSINTKVMSNAGTFVLKKYPYSLETYDLLVSENNLLKQLGEQTSYDFSKTIPSTMGDLLIVEEEEKKIYRLLTFVEGEFLGDVPHHKTLLSSLGTFLGTMDKEISGNHETAIRAKETVWDLQHFDKNYGLVQYIEDPKLRNRVDYFFLQFSELILPHAYLLRKGIIHNDANHWNVLTKNGKVSGIIDFGDMCHSWLINELAIAITYVMMEKENPIEIAAAVIEAYHLFVPLEEIELHLLYYLVAARLCTSVCNSARTKLLKPDSAYITISEKPAWSLLEKWFTISPIRAEDEFRKAAGYQPKQRQPLQNQIESRKKHISEALSLSYERPYQMERAAFQYMYDTSGNTILDGYNNIMLAGHAHPKIVRAGQRAMAQLNTNTRYLYESLLTYSEQLLSKFPPSLNKVFFVNSGSAASDLAIRMAHTHTQKRQIVVLEHGYHGNTRLGIDISHYKYNHKGGTGKNDYIVQTPMPKVFGSGMEDNGEAGAYYADLTIAQLAKQENSIAAFISEPIVGCGGQVPLAKDYLKKIYPEIRARGGICISDEVQVGFGRLGDHFWGYEMHEVLPDMVILGKPMGNGHPIAAVVTTDEVAASFHNGLEFFSSFGGNPVSCAIGLAVLEVIEEEGLQQHAKKTGDYLKKLLNELKSNYHEIADVRGSGLFLGVEIVDTYGKPSKKVAAKIKNELREHNILIGTDGPHDSVLKIKPPLSFTKVDCEILVGRIAAVMSEITKK